MRENRIDWPQFFRPVCVLCMVCGGLWLWWQMSLTENLLGRITAIAGGVLFLLGGLFGLLGKPRALVPLLDFLAVLAGHCRGGAQRPVSHLLQRQHRHRR